MQTSLDLTSQTLNLAADFKAIQSTPTVASAKRSLERLFPVFVSAEETGYEARFELARIRSEALAEPSPQAQAAQQALQAHDSIPEAQRDHTHARVRASLHGAYVRAVNAQIAEGGGELLAKRAEAAHRASKQDKFTAAQAAYAEAVTAAALKNYKAQGLAGWSLVKAAYGAATTLIFAVAYRADGAVAALAAGEVASGAVATLEKIEYTASVGGKGSFMEANRTLQTLAEQAMKVKTTHQLLKGVAGR